MLKQTDLWAQIFSIGCLTITGTKILKHWIWETFTYVPFCDLNSTHFLILPKCGLKFYPYGEEGLFRPYVSEVTAAVSSTQDFLQGSWGKKIKVWKRAKSTDMHKFLNSSPCVTGYIWNYGYDGKKIKQANSSYKAYYANNRVNIVLTEHRQVGSRGSQLAVRYLKHILGFRFSS